MSVELKPFMTAEEMAQYAKEHAGELYKTKYSEGRLIGVFKEYFMIECPNEPYLSQETYLESIKRGARYAVTQPIKTIFTCWPRNIFPLNKQANVSHTMTTRHPHSCPSCKAPAYIGFTTIECSKNCGVR